MKKMTIPAIRQMKSRKKIAMITAYDAQTARLVDASGVDIVLVGDSLGTVVLGLSDPLKVTMDHMLHHVEAVARGVSRCLIVADLPFGSMQQGGETLVRDAIALMRAGAHAVKIEGANRLETIRDLVNSGIPVMGHLGLTPQSINAFGGYRIQGLGEENRELLVSAAKGLEKAGVFAMVIECVPSATAEKMTAAVSVPTIGIGAGSSVDGQVLVINDLLNMDASFKPRFVKHYANISKEITDALTHYVKDVREEIFPASEHEYEDSTE